MIYRKKHFLKPKQPTPTYEVSYEYQQSSNVSEQMDNQRSNFPSFEPPSNTTKNSYSTSIKRSRYNQASISQNFDHSMSTLNVIEEESYKNMINHSISQERILLHPKSKFTSNKLEGLDEFYNVRPVKASKEFYERLLVHSEEYKLNQTKRSLNSPSSSYLPIQTLSSTSKTKLLNTTSNKLTKFKGPPVFPTPKQKLMSESLGSLSEFDIKSNGNEDSQSKIKKFLHTEKNKNSSHIKSKSMDYDDLGINTFRKTDHSKPQTNMISNQINKAAFKYKSGVKEFSMIDTTDLEKSINFDQEKATEPSKQNVIRNQMFNSKKPKPMNIVNSSSNYNASKGGVSPFRAKVNTNKVTTISVNPESTTNKYKGLKAGNISKKNEITLELESIDYNDIYFNLKSIEYCEDDELSTNINDYYKNSKVGLTKSKINIPVNGGRCSSLKAKGKVLSIDTATSPIKSQLVCKITKNTVKSDLTRSLIKSHK